MATKRKGAVGKTQKTTKVNNVKENNKSRIRSNLRNVKIKEEVIDDLDEAVTIRKRGRPKKGNSASNTQSIVKKNLKYDSVIIKVNNKEVISIPEFPDIKIKVVKGGKHPYICPKCDSGFWTKSAYESHIPIHILRKAKQPVKKFRCDVCAKEFSKLCDVERHTRVHTGEKPCICNICNKRFQQAHNLSKHLLTHLHLKPFHCEICNKQFGRNDVLRRHLLTHSVDKPVKCSVCHRGFIRHSQLPQHMRRKHPDHPMDEQFMNELNEDESSRTETGLPGSSMPKSTDTMKTEA